MSESLRDRVARVLYEQWVSEWEGRDVPAFGEAHDFDKEGFYDQADALIAAGLVAEPEWEYGLLTPRRGFIWGKAEPWRTRESAEAWMLNQDSLVRRNNRNPGEWQEVTS